MGWKCLSIPKLQRWSRWCLGIDKSFRPTLYWVCDFLSMLGFNRVRKRDPWCRIYVVKKSYHFPIVTSVCVANPSFHLLPPRGENENSVKPGFSDNEAPMQYESAGNNNNNNNNNNKNNNNNNMQALVPETAAAAAWHCTSVAPFANMD